MYLGQWGKPRFPGVAVSIKHLLCAAQAVGTSTNFRSGTHCHDIFLAQMCFHMYASRVHSNRQIKCSKKMCLSKTVSEKILLTGTSARYKHIIWRNCV
jgi:hypothetical protein